MASEAIVVPLSYVLSVATPVVGTLCGAIVTMWKVYADKASTAAEKHAAELSAARAEGSIARAEAEAKCERARVEHSHEREQLLRSNEEQSERRLAEHREAFDRERRLREEHLRDVKQSADALAIQADMVEMLREATTRK